LPLTELPFMVDVAARLLHPPDPGIVAPCRVMLALSLAHRFPPFASAVRSPRAGLYSRLRFTPLRFIEKEDDQTMSDEPEVPPSEDFATLFAQQQSDPALEVGEMVKGRVIQIGAENVFVDVGGKGEAWIDRAELTDDEGRLKIAVGDPIEAIVVATGDEIRLSHKLRQGAQARQALG